MREIIALLRLSFKLDKRSGKKLSQLAYYTVNVFAGLVMGLAFFIIIFIEAKNIIIFNAMIDVFLFIILFFVIIGSLTKYVAKVEISPFKINYLPIKKRNIYIGILLSDLLSFRNFGSFSLIFAIYIFTIKRYGFYMAFSIILLLVFYFSCFIWIRNILLLLDNVLINKKIRDKLSSGLFLLAVSIYIMFYLADKINLESNPERIIEGFRYLPIGWAGNAMTELISHSLSKAVLDISKLVIFALIGMKIGLMLINRKNDDS